MMRRKGLSIAEVPLILVALLIVAAVLLPVFVRTGGHGHWSICMSNMQQIGKAVKQYLTDWDDTYPTNRHWVSPGKLGPITDQVKLSVPGVDKKGNPNRFDSGVNWVEGLYAHIEAITDSRDQSTVWRCPNASNETYPAGSETAAVTYALNGNLVGKSEQVIRGAGNLMLVREMDRCVEAVLRPVNDSTGNPSTPPISPFLTGEDVRLGRTHATPHTNGSHVLFADSHVKYCVSEYYPRRASWDAETKQWYNFNKDARVPDALKRTIAITP